MSESIDRAAEVIPIEAYHAAAAAAQALADAGLLATPERDAEQRRAGAIEALRGAADAYLDEYGTWGGASQGAWLRERADRIEAKS